MAIKRGTAASDTIKGTSTADTIYGLGGNDSLFGLGGADTIYGHDGADRIWGGADADSLVSHGGNDQLFGEAGDDSLYGGDGNDTLSGGSGNDVLRGERGDDVLNGGGGKDSLSGGSGNDQLLFEASGLVTGTSKTFHGDGGMDTLRVVADGATISGASGVIPATVVVEMSHTASGGTVSFADRIDGSSSVFVDGGSFSGVERFEVSENTSLLYAGSGAVAHDVTVTGGAKDDAFFSGLGDEIFSGGDGQDEYVFFGAYGDTDRLVGFDADADLIVTTLWSDGNGDPVANRSIAESAGHTIVTTTDFSGDVVHTLDIDAIGLPLDIFKDGYAWG